MDINLGENLKTLRIRSRRTLEDVAEIIDVSRQSVSKWESGESYPDIEKCVRLSKLYNVSLDALINKPLEELINEDGKRDRYVFGLTVLGKNGTIRLPQKAIEIFEITEKDALLVVGDKTQGILFQLVHALLLSGRLRACDRFVIRNYYFIPYISKKQVDLLYSSHRSKQRKSKISSIFAPGSHKKGGARLPAGPALFRFQSYLSCCP